MNSAPPPLPPKKPLTLPVILAFVPAALALLLASLPIPKGLMTACFNAGTVISIVCCTLSSIAIFKRNTSAAIVFGVLLVLLNLALSAGFGCAALVLDYSSNTH